MAALALTATLYHVASHAFFKSLLFLGTGSVLHATSERNLGKLGGLIRTMPWVGWLTLLGCWPAPGCRRWAVSSRNGCCCRASCSPGLPVPLLTMLIPVVAALIALVAALAGYTMVKFFGVIFLGPAARGKTGPGARRRPLGTCRHGVAGAGLRAAGAAAGAGHPCSTR
jgi:hydrogenase-4 component B